MHKTNTDPVFEMQLAQLHQWESTSPYMYWERWDQMSFSNGLKRCICTHSRSVNFTELHSIPLVPMSPACDMFYCGGEKRTTD